MIISYSRDKSVPIWCLTTPEHHSTNKEAAYGIPSYHLTDHSRFVQDVVLSSDGQFALSGSWDGDLCLWDLNTGVTTRRFVGHTNDVLSVAFSIDNCQIVTTSRDRTIKFWNTLGECKFTIQDGDSHTVKVWNLTNCKIRCTLAGHGGYVNTVAVSPVGSLCANGGKDGVIFLWVLAEGKNLYSLASGITHALCFSPNRYWLCAATEHSMKIWDLESKSIDCIVEDLMPNLTEATPGKSKMMYFTSWSWSSDGSTLFTGYTDLGTHTH